MKTIVIIGANSTIGQQLKKSLTLKMSGYQLICSSRNSSDPYFLDLCQPESFHWLEGFPNAIFVLCAAMTKIDECLLDPEKSHQVNVVNMKTLIDTILLYSGFPIFLSSNRVFSNSKSKMTIESPVQPDSLYGEQKAQVEQYLFNTKKPYIIVRLAKVINNNFPLLKKWQNQIEAGESINAFSDFNMAPVLLSDVGNLLALLCDKPQVGIFQLSGEASISYYEIAKKMCVILEKDVKQVTATLYADQVESPLSSSLMKNHWPNHFYAETTIDAVLKHIL